VSWSVSVIVPARNAARTLQATLHTVARGDRVGEILVVDDGSSDGTPEVARQAGTSSPVPLRVVAVSPPDSRRGLGPSAARNAGAAAAGGDVLAFVDADDLWMAGVPDDRLAALDAGAAVAVGRVQCLTDTGTTVRPFAKPFDAFVNGSALIRRDCFDAVGGFDPSLDRGEDLDWYLRALGAGHEIAWVDQVVLGYRLHPGSATAPKGERGHGLLVALHRSITRAAPENGAPPPSVEETISVVLPVRDAASHLESALEALAAQSRPPCEILVVDGGSRDATCRIARGAQGVALLELPGSNVPQAHNAGLLAARGDLVAFAAADDLLCPGALAAHADALAATPDAAMSLGLTEFFADAGGMSPRVPDGLAGTVRRARILEAVMVRRSTVRRIGPFLADLGSSADIEWVQRLADAGAGIVEVDTVVVRKRLHQNNASYSRDEVRHDLLRALRAGIERKRSVG